MSLSYYPNCLLSHFILRMGMALEGTVILRYADLINNGFRSWSMVCHKMIPRILVCTGLIFPIYLAAQRVSRFNAVLEVHSMARRRLEVRSICLQFHFNQSQASFLKTASVFRNTVQQTLSCFRLGNILQHLIRGSWITAICFMVDSGNFQQTDIAINRGTTSTLIFLELNVSMKQ